MLRLGRSAAVPLVRPRELLAFGEGIDFGHEPTAQSVEHLFVVLDPLQEALECASTAGGRCSEPWVRCGMQGSPGLLPEDAQALRIVRRRGDHSPQFGEAAFACVSGVMTHGSRGWRIATSSASLRV